MMQALAPTPDKMITLWLRTCIALVLAMVVIGGLTRLTESGLSIVEWKLFSGTFPPMTTEAWQEAFAHYQETPEFKIENAHMNLEEFKGIFWLEYIHRLLGRVIGLAYLLPLLWFSARNRLPTGLKWQMWGVFALVCAQGVVGWYMVKSGLVNDPRVSPYRLAFHLGLATIIAALTYWLLETYNSTPATPQKNNYYAWSVLALIMVQLFYGALVAGLHAGMIYNTYPLMGGQFLPPEGWKFSPWVRNLFEHAATVQFIHRWAAIAVFIAAFWQWKRFSNRSSLIVLYIVLVQIALGILTLLSVVAIPIASAHQLTAVILVLCQVRVIINAPARNRVETL